MEETSIEITIWSVGADACHHFIRDRQAQTSNNVHEHQSECTALMQ
jgi:hypothetical protein